MDPSSWGQILGILILTLLNGFFAATETSVISVSRARIQQLADDGAANARIVHGFHQNIDRFLTTIQIAITTVGFLASAIGAVSFADDLSPFVGNEVIAVILITLSIAFVSIVLGEIVPKTMAITHAERFSLLTARVILVIQSAFYPLVWLISRSSNLITHRFGQEALTTVPTVTEEEIKMMVDTGGKEGVIEEGEREMIHGVFELGELTVGDIMSPRVDIVTLESDNTLVDAIRASADHGYSRIPVYEETIDNIKGVVYVKDILPYVAADTLDTLVRDVMREPYFVPESKKLSDFLQEMQQRRVHVAICVDEFGGVAGLVTIEDVLEEIVGEIQDEHDAEEPQVEMVNELEAVVDPAISMHDLNDVLGISLENEEVDTLGGVIYAQLGRMADEGDELQIDGITVSVLSVEGTRIRKALVRKEPRAEPSESGEEGGSG